jgi:hypothetical protein
LKAKALAIKGKELFIFMKNAKQNYIGKILFSLMTKREGRDRWYDGIPSLFDRDGICDLVRYNTEWMYDKVNRYLVKEVIEALDADDEENRYFITRYQGAMDAQLNIECFKTLEDVIKHILDNFEVFSRYYLSEEDRNAFEQEEHQEEYFKIMEED